MERSVMGYGGTEALHFYLESIFSGRIAEKIQGKETEKKEKPSNENFSFMFLEVPSRFELL